MNHGRNWEARVAVDIGQRLAHYRAERGLTAQQLADRCAKLGMKALTRVVITRLENGRRESVSTAEVQVLAWALGVPPVLLLFPLGYVQAVEWLPGREADPWGVIEWFHGDRSDPADPSSPPQMGAHSPIGLWNEHAGQSHLLAVLTEERRAFLSKIGVTDEGARTSLDMQIGATVTALRRIREAIRGLGMTPPELEPGIAGAVGEAQRFGGSLPPVPGEADELVRLLRENPEMTGREIVEAILRMRAAGYAHSDDDPGYPHEDPGYPHEDDGPDAPPPGSGGRLPGRGERPRMVAEILARSAEEAEHGQHR